MRLQQMMFMSGVCDPIHIMRVWRRAVREDFTLFIFCFFFSLLLENC